MAEFKNTISPVRPGPPRVVKLNTFNSYQANSLPQAGFRQNGRGRNLGVLSTRHFKKLPHCPLGKVNIPLETRDSSGDD